MSFPSDKQYINKQYDVITQALSSGERLVFDKKNNAFETTTRSAAKNLSKEEYITDLSHLKTKIEEFVSNNGIEDWQKNDMEKAFSDRAEKLSKRFVLFGGAKRDQAVSDLKGFQEVIERAAKFANKKLGQQQPPSPTQELPPIPTSPPPPRPQGRQDQDMESIFGDVETVSSPLPPSQKQPPPSPLKVEEREPEGVPSPPAGGPPPPPSGVKAPPPPPGAKGPAQAKPKGPSPAQKNIMKPRALVEGEQSQPKLPESVDAGNNATFKNLSPEQKSQLREDIKNYLEGKVVQKSTPSGKPLPATRSKDGLGEKIKMIEQKIAAHTNAVKSLASPQSELTNLEDALGKMKRRLNTWNESQARGESYTMNTTTKDKETGMISSGKPITYYSERDLQNDLAVFNSKSEEQKALIKKGLATEKGHTRTDEDPIPEQRTLAGLIRQQEALIDTKRQQIENKQSEIATIKNQIEKLETEKSGDVPFKEYKAFIEDRKELEKIYNNILRWIPVEEEAAKEAKQQNPLEQAMKGMTLIQEERTQLAALGAQKKMIMNSDLTQLLENDEIMTDYEIKEANQR